MSLEHWDEDRRSWVFYRKDTQHSEDCAKYPYETIPSKVCLDTNVVNLLVKRSDQIFYQIPIPSGLDLTAAEDIGALMHVFTVSARAGWGILASAKTPEEIRKTQNPSTGDNLLDYATDLVPPRTEDSAFATHLGRLLVDAPFTTALTDPPDRELIGNAIGFHCDV